MTIHPMRALARYLDPRLSLASAIGWLMFVLSIGLVLVASVWVDDTVGTNLIEQREEQLNAMADRIAAELNLNLALRLQSVRTVAALLATELRDENRATIRRILGNLQRASPEFEWIDVASPQGRILAATDSALEGASVAEQSWFALGLNGSKIADARLAPSAAKTLPAAANGTPGPFVDLIASVIGAEGAMLGVIGTQLSSRWLRNLVESLGPESRGATATEALVLDQEGTVLIGPARHKLERWKSARESADTAMPVMTDNVSRRGVERPSRIEQLADGRRYLLVQAKLQASDALQALGWRVLVLQPLENATQHAKILESRITAILLGLGLLAALLGVMLARRVTRDLGAIARSADAVRAGTTQKIAVPPGRNEAARLGRTLDLLLTSLQRERGALQTLNVELDQRVAARTREIERMADQARYAAVVRERLKIARDLHDTLAHSMMAMLAEIRFLKRLSSTDPGAMAEELTRAEETAHQGLKEARAAITQMRFNPVRDAGLAAALGDLAKSFVERTGIPVDYTSDAPAGTFADEQAETMFRIAEETLRNVERHAGASRVAISLRAPGNEHGLTLVIADDGVGFDADATHPGHYGLAGLREQARMIGATLTILSTPQQGTTVSVALAPGADS